MANKIKTKFYEFDFEQRQQYESLARKMLKNNEKIQNQDRKENEKYFSKPKRYFRNK